VLIDCGADWLGRFERLRPHAIVLTHAHPDHAFGLARGAPCPVWSTPECWASLQHFPIEQRRTVVPGRRHRIETLIVQAFTVEHSIRAPAVGYRITAGGATIFYVPDLVFIHERGRALRGVHVYIGDGATLKRPLVRRRGTTLIGHAAVSTQLGWCAQERVARAIITHCGSQIVTAPHARTAAAVKALGKERGVRADLAYDGLRVTLRARKHQRAVE
jgi:phosphoribosyl 1,2-cyclic phosphodiesterase